jgi:hypothetical protein
MARRISRADARSSRGTGRWHASAYLGTAVRPESPPPPPLDPDDELPLELDPPPPELPPELPPDELLDDELPLST